MFAVISVFECAESNVVIVQQRVPLIKVIHCLYALILSAMMVVLFAVYLHYLL